MKTKSKVRIASVICIVILIIIEVFIQAEQNVKASDKTALLLLDQVVSIVERNDKAQNDLVISLKEDYIIRAQTVSYILEHNSGIEDNHDELLKIADLAQVDEINLISEDGVIYGGTVQRYYGMTLDSGEQIQFFEPMLKDKTLSLCQDVTPNTAERKYMMYAAVWRDDGSSIVQIGIEPKRLIGAIGNNSLGAAVDTMPMVAGIDIYVSTVRSGLIVASTQEENVGKHLNELGILPADKEKKAGSIHFEIMDHAPVRCCFKNYDKYDIGIVYGLWTINREIIITGWIVLAYLCIAAIVIDLVVQSREKNKEKASIEMQKLTDEKEHQFKILASMSQIYYTMHLIDLIDFTVVEYSSKPQVKKYVNQKYDAVSQMKAVMEHRGSQEFRERLLKFSDLTTVAQRMKGKKTISFDFINVDGLWTRCVFIMITKDKDEMPTSVIFATQIVDDEKRKEENLLFKSNTDELTGFYNRRAFEEDLASYEMNGIPDDFALISMDINGLKTTNDTLGHAAGDELIKGSADCMRVHFSSMGKLYRTGGDEFFAVLEASPNEVKNSIEEFNEDARNWSGELINSIYVSCGSVTRKEFPEETISEMESVADKRMYKAKALYYSSKGVDRRSRQAAFTVICDTYERILKINLNADTYQLVCGRNVEEVDINPPAKLSDYFSFFAYNGGVHIDDIDEFLKKTKLSTIEKFFIKNNGLNKTYSFTYRRLIGKQYRKVLFEIISSKDYSEDNQELFLYVKAIEK